MAVGVLRSGKGLVHGHLRALVFAQDEGARVVLECEWSVKRVVKRGVERGVERGGNSFILSLFLATGIGAACPWCR
jgi:hypothetical protein